MDTTFSNSNASHTLTKREYFAANAPEAPDWFKHVEAEKPVRPNFVQAAIALGYSPSQAEEMRGRYYNDDAWTIPENLVPFNAELDKYVADQNAWEYQNKIDRFFQWRTFYADQLIKQLNR